MLIEVIKGEWRTALLQGMSQVVFKLSMYRAAPPAGHPKVKNLPESSLVGLGWAGLTRARLSSLLFQTFVFSLNFPKLQTTQLRVR